MVGQGSVGARKARTKFQAVGVAYAFAVSAIVVEVLAAMFIILSAAGWIKADPAVINNLIIGALIVGFFLSAIVLFICTGIVVYVIRLFTSLFLVWVTMGFILYISYSSNSPEMQLTSVVSFVLFGVITLIFYISTIIQKRMINLINEHKVAIERLGDLLARVSTNIPKEDAAQLSKFLGGAKRSWASFVRSTLVGSDVARVFYKALLITNVFFLSSYYLSFLSISDFIKVYGMRILFVLIIFSLIVTLLDVTRVEKIRRQILVSV